MRYRLVFELLLCRRYTRMNCGYVLTNASQGSVLTLVCTTGIP
ncbi:unnamed protein product [Acanthoscelides obtectus]|uniref:Uncharacterized protein n=1 Tax=Acanthoscelides obtectus TaxID=200917 RepID=A0A9P0PJF2_ACAOB|nr:unnamed protein product [Acanthoscelides obtectus]CAK1638509.1 hypothetical protein AOBTE_LOCUS10640 [Acanthoscelides obtectus]